MWSSARRRRLRLILTIGIVASGLASAGLAATTEDYWQGLLLNIGSSLLVAAPLALIGSWLIDEVKDLQARATLKEAQLAVRSAVEIQHERLWERRMLTTITSDQVDILDRWREHPGPSWDLAEDMARRVVYTLDVHVAGPAKEAAEKAGLVGRFNGPYKFGLVLDWERISDVPPIQCGAADWCIGSPYKEDPCVWCISVAAFPISEDSITVLFGHHILNSERYAERPWIGRATLNVYETKFATAVADIAAKARGQVPIYLESLAVLMSQ